MGQPAHQRRAPQPEGSFNREGIEALWILADLVLVHGYTGIFFPSQVNEGGTNVVVYSGRLKDGNSVIVNDPDGRFPRDLSTWER